MKIPNGPDLVTIERLLERVEGLLHDARNQALPLNAGSNETGHLTGASSKDYLRRPRAALPDKRLIRQIIRQRRLRDRYFENDLFADPGWDILLDLTAARVEQRRISVTSLCAAAAVPPTTALRWIHMMTKMGVLVREKDDLDQRRTFIALSESAADSMARYFDEIGRDAARQI